MLLRRAAVRDDRLESTSIRPGDSHDNACSQTSSVDLGIVRMNQTTRCIASVALHSWLFKTEKWRRPCSSVTILIKEPLIKLRIMAYCALDSRATVWTGS